MSKTDSFNFSFSNPTDEPQNLELLSAISTNTRKSKIYRFTTPYAATYPSGSEFIFRYASGQSNWLIGSEATPQDVVDYFNKQDIGTVSLFKNNAVDGTIYDVQSPLVFQEFETNLSNSNFRIGTGFSNECWESYIYPNNELLLATDATDYNGTAQQRLFKLGKDGEIDISLNLTSGFNNQIRDIGVDSDGKIIAVGVFNIFKGVLRNRIARLNTDGTYDNTFVIGSGLSDWAFTVEVQSDNKIVVGGRFISYNGVATNRIARVNTDGSIDLPFTINIGTASSSWINKIKLQSDGKIVAGGNFLTFNSLAHSRIVRLNSDGTIDGSFTTGTGFNTNVYTIEIQSDGKIIAGGVFTSYNGNPANRIARLNTDGTYDNTFVIGSGFNGDVYSLKQQSDGKILVGGNFSLYNGNPANGIARLNTDGTYDNTFVIGSGFNGIVRSFEVQSDGKIIVMGSFSEYKGNNRNRIARLLSDGSDDTVTS